MSEDALFEAIDDDDPEAARRILALEPGLARSRDGAGVSALLRALHRRAGEDVIDAVREHAEPLDAFEAAAVGATDRLRAVLDERPQLIGAQTADGFSLLHLAASFGRSEAVEELLERGADPHAVAGDAMRAQPLHSAAAAGDGRSVALLLEAGANPDARQHDGFVALHAAARNGDEDMVDQLMDAGADLGMRADDGSTAASLSHAAGHEELARRLGG